jgi:hypothetical protein
VCLLAKQCSDRKQVAGDNNQVHSLQPSAPRAWGIPDGSPWPLANCISSSAPLLALLVCSSGARTQSGARTCRL